jgi:hypothetical protein
MYREKGNHYLCTDRVCTQLASELATHEAIHVIERKGMLYGP